jgi:hypothetical protein
MDKQKLAGSSQVVGEAWRTTTGGPTRFLSKSECEKVDASQNAMLLDVLAIRASPVAATS